MVLRGFARVVRRVCGVPVCNVRVMRALLVIVVREMLRRFAMMFGCLLVMLCRLLVMRRALMSCHGILDVARSTRA
jgi:hypothetical protein